jgi:hypothetical protein
LHFTNISLKLPNFKSFLLDMELRLLTAKISIVSGMKGFQSGVISVYYLNEAKLRK